MNSSIITQFIFEILGKPPEYLKESLEKHIKNLEMPGVKVLSKVIHEPKPLENEDGIGLYSSYAEVELEVDNLNLLFGIVIKMLPSHIEVISPTDLTIKNFDLSAALSDLAIKLHKYDEVAKVLTMDNQMLLKELKKIKDSDLHKPIVKEIIETENKKVDIKKKKK